MDITTHDGHSDPAGPKPTGHFHALINGKPFISSTLNGWSCLRPELTGNRTRQIWKIIAVGQVARSRTIIGLFIDQALAPGTYDLVRNDQLTAVYHLTPRQIAQVYHSRDFRDGCVTLVECDVQTGRLRGAFEFSMSGAFSVTGGEFDLLCPAEEPPHASAD